jgi:hypothetical protein
MITGCGAPENAAAPPIDNICAIAADRHNAGVGVLEGVSPACRIRGRPNKAGCAC